ncbi:MAG: hypothetical protein NW207_07180 [Cytophagales bacterium]|nr:hypothetical protein [Cytophagales bacterium]
MTAYAQKPERYEADDNQEQQEYDKEFTYGLNWNTNAGILGGVNIKFAIQTKKSQLRYNILSWEFVNIEHPKEFGAITAQPLKIDNGYYRYAPQEWSIGQESYFFVMRLNAGKEIVIFRKSPDEGVQVSWINAAGPSWGIKKPYYVRKVDENYDLIAVPYSPNFSDADVYGSDSFFKGWGETINYLGFHAKTSLNFEFGHYRNSVSGLEVGVMLEQFPKKIVMLPKTVNNSFFTSIFFNLYIGIR